MRASERPGPAPPAGWRRWLRPRTLARLALVVGAVTTAYVTVTAVQVWRASRHDDAGRFGPATPVDAIVVMGAAQYDGRPSPVLEARLRHALALWDAGLARHVVVTGGNRPGDRFTEAGVSERWLVERGVPAEVIFGEDTGRSSWASLAAIAGAMEDRGLRRVLLVSAPYHARRILEMSRALGLDASVSPVADAPDRPTPRRLLQETAAVAVGRIIGFDRLDALDPGGGSSG